MKIRGIKLQNFKGLSIDIAINKIGCQIFGANATGKTTIAESVIWCMTGKDLQDRKDHEIQTIGTDNLEHSVTIETFSGDVLTRIYKQKYAKNRKTLEMEFQGFTTDFKMDDKKVSKKDFESKVLELVKDIDTFKIINNPLHIENLNWKVLRSLISKSDFDIEKKVDDIDRIKKQCRELDKDIEKLNAQIEGMENTPVESDISANDIEGQRSKVNAIKSILEVKEVNPDKEFNDKLKSVQDEIRKADKNYNDKQNTSRKLKCSKVDLLGELRFLESQKTYSSKNVQEIRDKYKEIFLSQDSKKCFHCKQALPIEMIDKMKNDKAERLRELTFEGKQLNDKIAEADKKITELNKSIAELDKKIKQSEEIEDKLLDTLKSLEIEYENLLANNKADESKSRLKSELEKEQGILEEMLLKKQSIFSSNQLETLKKSRDEEVRKYLAMNGKVETLEAELHENLAVIEKQVNSKFEKVQFQLFKTTQEGNVKETCIPLINNIPWSTVNNAARINAGIEISNVISEMSGIEAPVFIDNAESVNKLVGCSNQLLAFYVTTDEKLKILGGTINE